MEKEFILFIGCIALFQGCVPSTTTQPGPKPTATASKTPQKAPTQAQSQNPPSLASPKPADVNANKTARDIINAEASRFSKSYFKMYDDHDDTYFNMAAFEKTGQLPKNSKRTIIHFDYHADMYRNDSHLDGNINIGNYINTMIWKGQVGAVWWIVPDDTRSNKSLSSEPGCASIRSQQELYWGRPTSFKDWQFRDGPADQLICVAPSGSFSFKAASEACAVGSRSVPVFKRTLGDILNSTNAAITGPTILDIDCDFFDNSGSYANEDAHSPQLNIGKFPKCYSTHYSPERVEEELKRFAIAITQKMNLRPDYIGVARSPGYTVENTEKIFSFMQALGAKARK